MFSKDEVSPADFDHNEDDLLDYIEATDTAREKHEAAKMEGTREMLDRLPFEDCALAGCDGYAEDGEKYCAKCLEALRESVK
jgi:hypothetical protein